MGAARVGDAVLAGQGEDGDVDLELQGEEDAELLSSGARIVAALHSAQHSPCPSIRAGPVPALDLSLGGCEHVWAWMAAD